MAEKLTMKALSSELDKLRTQMRDMEIEFEQKLENALEKAADKVKSRLEKSQHKDRPVKGSAVDTETRNRLIQQTAYLRAERRGFAGGDPEQDWLEAEIEVDRLLLESAPEKPARRRGRSKDQHQIRSRA